MSKHPSYSVEELKTLPTDRLAKRIAQFDDVYASRLTEAIHAARDGRLDDYTR